MTSSPDSSASAADLVGAERETCQSCGHDADDHSASWGCLATVPEWQGLGRHEDKCGCMVPRLRIIGDAQ